MKSRDWITGTFGLSTLGVAILGVAGAPRPVVIAVGLCAVGAAAGQLRSKRRLAGVSPLLVFLGIAIGLTALQLVPLPPGLRNLLDGTGHDLIDDAHLLLGDSDEVWRPLSVDPPATLVELSKFMAYMLVAWMALRAATSERGRARLMMAVAGSAGVVVVLALIHELLDAQTLYGVYTPAHSSPVVMAPFLNANHLACFMALGAIVSGGLALHEQKVPARRVLWIVIGVGCLAVMLMTRSRGGVVGFGAGSIVAAVLIVLQRLRAAGEGSRKEVLRIVIPAAVTVLCTIVLVIFVGGDSVTNELANTRLDELGDPRSKYAAWDSSLELVAEAPILGIGRGAFETPFTRVHPQSGEITFARVENEYLQTVIDWGVVGAIAFSIAIGFAAIVMLRRWHRGTLAAAAIGGLATVATQSLVDFGLELPGLAIPTIIVASTLLYVPLREATKSFTRQGMRVALIGLSTIVTLIAGSSAGRSLEEDHADLKAVPSFELAQDALRRHPLDYLSAAYIGNLSRVPSEQVAFVNHALRLHPTHPDLHLVVARWLAATKRYQQAAFEYRFALTRGFKVEVLVDEVIARMPADQVARALPTGNTQWSRITKALLDHEHADLAVAYLEGALADDGTRDLAFWKQLQSLAVLNGKDQLALRAARRLALLEPSISATIKIAEAQVKVGDLAGALGTLKAITSQPASSAAHLDARVLRCNIMVAQTAWVAAKACLSETLQLPTLTITHRRMLHGQMAKVETALGDPRAAALERELSGERNADSFQEIPQKVKAP